ncbi:uncharacterized protein LOC117482864 [Trematomus bernacchii]|uniref:uncharacterized protein LOC117482864 n=1 Tax=Trematomus bernacchii TaxID=40690 RepID=UPI00146AD11D|nr:uncharacterized protein LOC117482864 [Trematomus bernacchii]
MTCGVHLGIFLIVWVQAEHVRCLWASQAQSQNNNTYVGFRQNNREAGPSNYLQNRLRQAPPSSAQSTNLNIPSAVGSSFSRGPSTGSYTQTVSQPAKSGFAKVRLVQGSSVSKPNLNRVPKQRFHGLSSAIASSDSLSKSRNKDTGKSSSLFGAGAPEPNQIPARTKTSSSVRAKLVSKTDKPSRPSAPKNPSQTEVVTPYKSKVFSGNARGSYKATSMASSYGTSLESNVGNGPVFKPRSYSTSYDSKSSREGTSGKKFAPTKTHIIPDQFGGYDIRRLKAPGQEKVSVRKPQQAYQTPIKAYVAPQQQATNQAYQTPIKAYVAPQRQATNQAYVAPNKAYNAPQQQTPNRAYETPNVAPNKAYEAPNKAYNAPQQQTLNRAYETTNRAYVAPQQQTLNRAYETTNRAYVAPQRQATNQAYVAPNKAYNAPQQQTPNKAYEAPNKAYETTNRAYETTNRAYKTTNRACKTPNKARKTPNKAHKTAYETPNKAHKTAYETPNKAHKTAYETPNKAHKTAYETPNKAHKTPNRAYKTPKKVYVAPQRQATNQSYEAPNRAYVAPRRQAEPQAYISPQVKWLQFKPKWGQ